MWQLRRGEKVRHQEKTDGREQGGRKRHSPGGKFNAKPNSKPAPRSRRFRLVEGSRQQAGSKKCVPRHKRGASAAAQEIALGGGGGSESQGGGSKLGTIARETEGRIGRHHGFAGGKAPVRHTPISKNDTPTIGLINGRAMSQ